MIRDRQRCGAAHLRPLLPPLPHRLIIMPQPYEASVHWPTWESVGSDDRPFERAAPSCAITNDATPRSAPRTADGHR
eukprot:scaffold127570_cov28-Tisochrysis_lutea.AAC.2